MSFDRFRLSSSAPKEDTKLFTVIKPGGSYDLTFCSFNEFEEWRRQEEKANAIEFVKLDARRSTTARRPRYKEHVKLVCNPHLRENRRYSERTRDLSGRKVDSLGCRASISYKTFVHSDTVRVVYNRDHSHPYGSEGLPSLNPGLDVLTLDNTLSEIQLTTSTGIASNEEQSSSGTASPLLQVPALSMDPSSPQSSTCPTPPSLSPLFGEPMVSFSDAQDNYLADIKLNFDQGYARICGSMDPGDCQSQQARGPGSGNGLVHTPMPQRMPSPLVCLAPFRTTEVPQMDKSHERWARLAMLFDSVHTQALAFDYPEDSVDNLEIALLGLHLGSPLLESSAQGPLGLQMETTGTSQATECPMDEDIGEFFKVDEMVDSGYKGDRGCEEPLAQSQSSSWPQAPVSQF